MLATRIFLESRQVPTYHLILRSMSVLGLSKALRPGSGCCVPWSQGYKDKDGPLEGALNLIPRHRWVALNPKP